MSSPPGGSRTKTTKALLLERGGKAMIAIASIAGATVLAAIAGGSPSMIVLASLSASVIAGVILYRAGRRREQLVQRLCNEYESQVVQSHDRWQALNEEAQQTTSALSRMRDGVIMLTQSGEIELINPAARRLLTLNLETPLIGREFLEVARNPELNRAVTAARAGDGSQKVLIEVADRDVIRPVKIRVDRFVETGSEGRLLITLRDETESHRVDEMRREFVANISHELKTPLAAIKGYAETVELAINDDPDAASHFMSQIRSECQRLEKLVSDMMQLARAQAGRKQMNMTNVSLAEVIEESIKSYRPIALSKGVKLSADKASTEAQVKSDAEALLTIANNLIGNAVHYTPEGGSVRVFCREAGNCWAIAVEDNGVGISAVDQKRIFERFYRVEKSRRSKDGGTGIGLSIVKNLAMTMGGEVRVKSRPGKGSTFEVLLPRSSEPNVQ